jgi:hypothetical protein
MRLPPLAAVAAATGGGSAHPDVHATAPGR